MIERQPNWAPIREPQRAPHEEGNGSRGISPALNERAKPPPESTADKLCTYLQESLGVSQPEGEAFDVAIFATRALEGLNTLRDTIDHSRPPKESSLETMRRYYQEHEIPANVIHAIEVREKQQKAYWRGLEDALKLIDAHLLRVSPRF